MYPSPHAELDQLLRVVSANEAGHHNRFLRDREEVHTSPFVRDLYSIHFGKTRTNPDAPQMEKSQELEESQSASTDKRAIVPQSPRRNPCCSACSTANSHCWTQLPCRST